MARDLPRSGVAVARGGVELATVSGETVNGIPRVDPRARRRRGSAQCNVVVATKPGAAVHRVIAAPLDAPIMKATGGRVSLAVGAVPVVVLASTGARSGQQRETPLLYFTDGDDVILTASNYGGARHPGWHYNLVAHPECELRIGRRGGRSWRVRSRAPSATGCSDSPLTFTAATQTTRGGPTVSGRSGCSG